MSNLTRKEIIEAHTALESLTNTSIHGGGLAEELQESVLRALPDLPRPTMDDVCWEWDKHFLAIVEDTRDNKRYIMLFPDMSDHIRCIGEEPHGYAEAILREYLVPTGERYTLVDTQE